MFYGTFRKLSPILSAQTPAYRSSKEETYIPVSRFDALMGLIKTARLEIPARRLTRFVVIKKAAVNLTITEVDCVSMDERPP